MNTKNEFFADYFLRQIEAIKKQIEEFGKMDESYFGAEIEPDKTKSPEEQLDQLNRTDNILDSLTAIEEEWRMCVSLKENEGYPVIDTWNEYVEENSNCQPLNNIKNDKPILTINDLPENLKTRVETICQKENRDISKIWFKRRTINYWSMMEENENTLWEYDAKEGEIG